jgi:hypothetical protein
MYPMKKMKSIVTLTLIASVATGMLSRADGAARLHRINREIYFHHQLQSPKAIQVQRRADRYGDDPWLWSQGDR